MINKNNLLLLPLVLMFTSCIMEEPKISFEKPKMQIPKPEPIIINNKGSLYSKRGASLFADKKDLQIGDIIQVVISESLTSDSSNSRDTSNDRETALGGGVFTSMNGTALGSTTSSLNSKLGLNFGTESSSSFKGSVTAAVDESFETTLSVIIEETYQNGNYFIKGIKEILIDKQKQEIVISGVIRPYDITSDNSVQSSQIANLKIKYMKDGSEQNALTEPWGTKILNVLWPF